MRACAQASILLRQTGTRDNSVHLLLLRGVIRQVRLSPLVDVESVEVAFESRGVLSIDHKSVPRHVEGLLTHMYV